MSIIYKYNEEHLGSETTRDEAEQFIELLNILKERYPELKEVNFEYSHTNFSCLQHAEAQIGNIIDELWQYTLTEFGKTNALIIEFITEFEDSINDIPPISVIDRNDKSYNDVLVDEIDLMWYWEINDESDVRFLALESFETKYPEVILTNLQKNELTEHNIYKIVDLIKIFAVSCLCSKYFETESNYDREINQNHTTYCRNCGYPKGVLHYEQIYNINDYEEKINEGFKENTDIKDKFE